MLVLLLRVGERQFGLDASRVVEVTPYVPLHAAADAPAWLAGWLSHRGARVPVVDVSQILDGVASEHLLSTRLILLQRSPDATDGLIALLAERATAMARIEPPSDGGSIAQLDDGTSIELLQWTDLVPPALHAALPTSAVA